MAEKAELTECLAEKLVSHNIPNSLLTHSQEEVTMLLILHAVTVPHETNLVVSSQNTDVLLILVQMYPRLPVSAFFLSGKGRLNRNIGVGYVHKHFGQQRFLDYRVLMLSQAQTCQVDLLTEPETGASKHSYFVTMRY